MARVSGGTVKLEDVVVARAIPGGVGLDNEERLVGAPTGSAPIGLGATRASKPNAVTDDDDACVARWFVS